MKIIIGVGIAGYPLIAAGNTWAFLQWALGFRALGWEVWLAEEIESAKCVNERFEACSFEQSANRNYWEKILSEFQFQGTLFVDGVAENSEEFSTFARDAKIFLNISGHFKQGEYLKKIPHRVYLDLDPAFTQIWAVEYKCDMNFEGHNRFFSVGAQMNSARIPQTGRKWLPTLPPVDLNYWKPSKKRIENGNWTTVAHWRGYNDIEWNGSTYTSKAAEFEKIIDLPSKISSTLLLAADLNPKNEEYRRFSEKGWKFISNEKAAADWKMYRNFLAESRGEFSVAKGGYVVSRCGWFSDRSACYLALGKPVILQDTGWNLSLPEGNGLLSFCDADSAAKAIRKAEADYESHALAARQIAEQYLDAGKVAGNLVETLTTA